MTSETGVRLVNMVDLQADLASTVKPGTDRALELVSVDTNLGEVMMLAMMTSFLENQTNIIALPEQNPSIHQFLSRLLVISTSKNSDPWKEYFVKLIYREHTRSPLPIMDDFLRNQVEPIGASLEQRIKDLKNTLTIECSIDKKMLSSNMLLGNLREDQSPISKFLSSIGRLLMVRKDSQHTNFLEVLASVHELHTQYGSHHSIYHFIEFITIALTLIITDDKLDSRRIPAAFEKRLKEFKSGDDALIFLLPFTGLEPILKSKSDHESVAQKIESLCQEVAKESTSTVAGIIKTMCQESGLMADGIIIIRNLAVAAVSKLSMPRYQTKKISLESFMSGGANNFSDLSKRVNEVKGFLQLADGRLEIDIPEFKDLTLWDVLEPKGKLRDLLHKMMSRYNSQLDLASGLVGVQKVKSKSLIQLKDDDLFTVDHSELLDSLCKRESVVGIGQDCFERGLRFALYDRVVCAVKVAYDPSDLLFRYSDEQREETFGYFGTRGKMTSMGYTLLKTTHRSVQKVFSVTCQKKLLKLEQAILEASRKITSKNTNQEEEIRLSASFSIKCKYLPSLYRSVLLRKLEMVFDRCNLAGSYPGSFAVHRMANSRDLEESHRMLDLMMALAGSRTVESIIASLRTSGTSQVNGDWPLAAMEELRSVLKTMSSAQFSTDQFSVGDLLQGVKKICAEIKIV